MNKYEMGLHVDTNGLIDIENLGGLLKISQSTSNPTKIDLANVETATLLIDAPNADVTLTLKSLHDSSYINCKSLMIYIDEDFFGANLIGVQNDEFSGLIDTMEEI